MKINCLYGYFIFEEVKAGEYSDFVSTFGLSLVRKNNYFTFPELQVAPDYAIKGAKYLGQLVTKHSAGMPWIIMQDNALVFNFNLGQVVPIASIANKVSLEEGLRNFESDGLILPGSLTDEGKRVTDYAAHFSVDSLKFRYSEVTVQ